MPRFHLEGKFKLGQWVAVQRYSKDRLAAERITNSINSALCGADAIGSGREDLQH